MVPVVVSVSCLPPFTQIFCSGFFVLVVTALEQIWFRAWYHFLPHTLFRKKKGKFQPGGFQPPGG